MNLQFDRAELKPLVAALMTEIVEGLPPALALSDRPIYPHDAAANLLGVSPYTLHEWRKEGKLKGCKIGKKNFVYLRKDLLRFCEEYRG